jgi:NAD-dependent SIR2 family protein deacetylase
MGETASVRCVDCLNSFDVERRYKGESNMCPPCVKRYIEKHSTRSRIQRDGGGDKKRRGR